MKSKKWDIFLLVFGSITLISSFIGASENESLFGFEINIWIYRIIWLAIILSSFFGYRNKKKAEENSIQK